MLKHPDNPKNDRFYQGVFLDKEELNTNLLLQKVEKNTHHYITLVKDSLAKELDGPKNLYEPKPEKKASVFKNKETFYPQL